MDTAKPLRHLYTSRKLRLHEYLVLCTDNWHIPTDIDPVTNKQLNFTTVPAIVTCPKCIDILIEKKEVQLQDLKRRKLVIK